MKREEYLSPAMKVINLEAQQMLCGSTERLTRRDFNWDEEE